MRVICKLQREWCANVRGVCGEQLARCRMPPRVRMLDLAAASREVRDDARRATAAMCKSADYLLAAIRDLPGLHDT